jgi:DNA-directed RNA polymerase specialized sigma24 family protein
MMLMMLTKKYSMKPCFSGYTYREDMVAEALAGLCQNALKFNPERSNNPFAFYTTCITNSFLHILKNERKHRRIRDQLLIDIGENPSYNFVEDLKSHGVEYQTELSDLTTQIAEAKERMKKDAEVEKAKADALAAEVAALEAESETVTEIVIEEEPEEPEEPVISSHSLLQFE